MTQEIDLADGETYSITLDGEHDIQEVDLIADEYFKTVHGGYLGNAPPLDTPIESVTTDDGETVVEYTLENFDRSDPSELTDAEIEETLRFVDSFESWWNAK